LPSVTLPERWLRIVGSDRAPRGRWIIPGDFYMAMTVVISADDDENANREIGAPRPSKNICD
jgi:hypothetical protein